MNRKIVAMVTALTVAGGTVLPVYAEDTSAEPDIVMIADVSEAGDITDTTDNGDAVDIGEGASDITETVDTADTTETDISAIPEDEAQPEESADTDAAPADEADTTESDVSDDEFTEESGEIPDTAEEVTEDAESTADDTLLEDEEEFLASDWYTWDASTGTLTLKGQLPTTMYSYIDYDICYRSGIDHEEVRKIIITPGTKTGTNASDMFQGLINLTQIQGLGNLDTSKATNISHMFKGCSSLTSLDLRGFDTSNVRNMSSVFSGCSSLTSVDLSSFNTSKVTSMEYMFRDCTSLSSLDLQGFDTSNVTNMGRMFSNCMSLGYIIVSERWTVDKVAISSDMFENCMMLAGCKGTEYDPGNKSKEYACIDDAPTRPGYLSTDAVYTLNTPTVSIKTAFGGKTVQFKCSDPFAEIYFQTGSSNISLSSRHVRTGTTVFFNTPMTGADAAIYFKAYKNGRWSPVGKWGLLNVKIDKPIIVQSGAKSANNFKVYTQTKDSYIVYTLDGTVPSIEEGTQKLTVKNGRIVWGTSTVVNIPKGRTIKAIAIRNGLVTSDVMTYSNK